MEVREMWDIMKRLVDKFSCDDLADLISMSNNVGVLSPEGIIYIIIGLEEVSKNKEEIKNKYPFINFNLIDDLIKDLKNSNNVLVLYDE